MHDNGLDLPSSVRSNGASPPPSAPPVCFAYLDAANIFLGGAAVSAFRIGLAPSPQAASERRTFDPRTRINFRWLRHFVVGNEAGGAARTVCVGSQRAGGNEGVWRAANRERWDIITPLRSAGSREKEVDTTLVVVPMDDLLRPDVSPDQVDVTILSGDRDMLPLVTTLSRRGFRVDIIAWNHTISPQLEAAAHRFIALDPYFDHVCFREPQG